jgi:hypothetical protein
MPLRKTSLYLDEALLREAKIRAARERRTLTALLEEGLRTVLEGSPSTRRRRRAATHLPRALYRGDGRPNDHDDIYR